MNFSNFSNFIVLQSHYVNNVCKLFEPIEFRPLPRLRPWTPVGTFVLRTICAITPSENFWRRYSPRPVISAIQLLSHSFKPDNRIHPELCPVAARGMD